MEKVWGPRPLQLSVIGVIGRKGPLTDDELLRELRLAKANVAYALENCPVEGGIMTDAGYFSTKESFDALLKKLQAVEIKPANSVDVNDEELEFLIAASTYALEYCPG